MHDPRLIDRRVMAQAIHAIRCGGENRFYAEPCPADRDEAEQIFDAYNLAARVALANLGHHPHFRDCESGHPGETHGEWIIRDQGSMRA
jgi:hypothetical protein